MKRATVATVTGAVVALGAGSSLVAAAIAPGSSSTVKVCTVKGDAVV